MMYPHPVVLWLVNMGYGGGGVLTLGPCDIASGREGMNNREQVDGDGGGKEGSNLAIVYAVSRFGRMWATGPKIDILVINLCLQKCPCGSVGFSTGCVPVV